MIKHIKNRLELRQQGIALLKKQLGIRGFIEFMQDFGFSAGDYTKNREKWLNEQSVDEVINGFEKTK